MASGLLSEVLFQAHAGPQTTFLAATEFEVLYGGAAGGGKSEAILFAPLRYVHNPRFRALILRKTFPELLELMDRSMVFKRLGAKWNETKKRWTFPSGATVEFGYFETWKHHTRYQGQQYQFIGWDELGTCPEERFWTFLMSRCRSTDPTLPAQLRASANPGGEGHAWLKRRFITPCGEDGATVYVDPLTGLERRFIPSRVTDNPALMEGDPGYIKRLQALPDILRKQLLDGDWGAAAGMALSELNRGIHLVDPFPIPNHWWHFAALDWGYQHPFAWGCFAVGPEGLVVLRDSLRLWRRSPLEQAERVHEKLADLGDPKIRYTHAGHDCWADIKARGENVPTIAEQFARNGIPLMKANISRVAGLNNMRRMITTRGSEGAIVEPRFLIFRTPANLEGYETLESMVVDPDDPEDALKIDADEYGGGGDDFYDMVRYGLASRMRPARAPAKKGPRDRNHSDGLQRAMRRHKKRRRRRTRW